jgi:hypothetical protein
MKKTIFLGAFSAIAALSSASAEVDCLKLYLTVKSSVKAEQSQVLEIVTNEVASAPGCACEIVKAAIEGSNAKPKTVGAIVGAAITVAPEEMRVIAQCAIAVAPDSLSEVQAVLAKFDPNSGDSAHSAKGAKGAKAPAGEVAAMPNPLDFPGSGPIGPSPGSPGGLLLFPVTPPVIINPPVVTSVDPGN